MKKALAKSWVTALRSGKFKQATGVLKTTADAPCHCCLGVLLEVCTQQKTFQDHHKEMNYELENNTLLNDDILELVGLSSDNQFFLITHNDGETDPYTNKNWQKWSFNRIATWIEKKFVTSTKTKSK